MRFLLRLVAIVAVQILALQLLLGAALAVGIIPDGALLALALGGGALLMFMVIANLKQS